jgi:hypothetical protein
VNDLFLKQEQYKELDELMTYILGEMIETKDKVFIREGIIAYANRWHEMQVNAAEQSTINCNSAVVNASALEFTLTELASTSHNNHGIIKAELPHQYSKMKDWKKGDKLLVRHCANPKK